jgi:hypothetical protein
VTKSVPAAILAVMMATAPAVFAQTTTTPARPMAGPADADRPAPAAAGPAKDMFKTQSGELRAGEIIGSTVYDTQNRNIGRVKDMVVDRDGKVAAVVVDVGSFLGMGGKFVGVELKDLKIDNNRLTLNRTKEQLESDKSYQLEPKNG